MVGSSWTDSQWSQNYINGSHFKDGTIQTLNAANKIAWDNTGSIASQWGIFSVFGRVAYNYDSKYLFTFNIREDGSSNCIPITDGVLSLHSLRHGVYLRRILCRMSPGLMI